MKSIVNPSLVLLDKVGLKKTDSRITLLDILSKNKKPLSAKEITSKLSSDKVTTYRMLEAMNQKGLIRRVDTGEREARYEINSNNDDHHHLICIECKKIEDFTGCDSAHLIDKALKKSKNFKSVTYHSFDLFGVCNSCIKNKCA
jgi:Fe2+ or Zn2+ uptake regulation protein